MYSEDANNGPAFGTTKKTNKTNSTNSTASNGTTKTYNSNKLDGVVFDDVNGTGYGDGNTTYVNNDYLDNYASGTTSSNYWDDVINSYEDSLAAQKAAIQAGVEQNVNALNAQKTTTSQDYADAYRQLYLNNMKSQKNIGQQMAAQGVTGGASESTLLGLNTNYEDNLRQGKVAEQNALSELDQAIANAKLSGSIEEANAIASNAQNAASAYLTAWSQAQANEQAAAQLEASQNSENRQYAYNMAMAMLEAGTMPSTELLDQAGISTADAQTIVAQYVAAKNASGSGSTADNSWKNGLSSSGYYGNKTTASGSTGDSKRQEYQDEANDLAYTYQTSGGNISSVLSQLNQDYTKGNISITTYKALQNYYKNL